MICIMAAWISFYHMAVTNEAVDSLLGKWVRDWRAGK